MSTPASSPFSTPMSSPPSSPERRGQDEDHGPSRRIQPSILRLSPVSDSSIRFLLEDDDKSSCNSFPLTSSSTTTSSDASSDSKKEVPQMDVHREVLSENLFETKYGADRTEQAESISSCVERVKDQCGKYSLDQVMRGIFPIFTWLPQTKCDRQLVTDMVAGFTLGILLIPQGIAYALLAGLPGEYGLYTSIMPPLIYMVFGGCGQLSVGTFALTSLIFAQTLNKLVKDPNDLSEVASVTVAVSCAVGLIQIIMGLLHIGALTVYMAPPFINGFTTASAFLIGSSQLGSLFGIKIPKYSGIFGFIHTLKYLFEYIKETNEVALSIGLITCIMLYVCKFFSDGGRVYLEIGKPIHKRLKIAWPSPKSKKMLIPIPGELIVVILFTLVAYKMDLHKTHDLSIVGEIPQGLPPVKAPRELFTVLGSAASEIIVLAIISFSLSVSVAKSFANKYGYPLDASKELIALGICNAVSGMFSCYVASASLSRSAVLSSIGAKSLLHSIPCAIIIGGVLLFMAKWFYYLPKSVLAAIVLMAVRTLLFQFEDLPKLWRVRFKDFMIWIVTFMAVLILGVVLGLVVGLCVCIIVILWGTTNPPYSCLGAVASTEVYRDINRSNGAKEIPGIKMFRFYAPLYFPNLEYFEASFLKETVNKCVNPNRPNFHTIILDMSPCCEIDASGVEMLVKITKSMKRLRVRLLLAYCRGPVRDVLAKCKYDEMVKKKNLFVSVHDAVLFALDGSRDMEDYLADRDMKAEAANDLSLMEQSHDVEFPFIQLRQNSASLLDDLHDTNHRSSNPFHADNGDDFDDEAHVSDEGRMNIELKSYA